MIGRREPDPVLMQNADTLRRFLRNDLKRYGWNMRQLAEAMNRSPSVLYNFLRAGKGQKTRFLSLPVIEEMCNILGISYDEMLGVARPGPALATAPRAEPIARPMLPAVVEPTPGPGPSIFSFEGAAVRVLDRDGGPWFVLADVCRVLEIANPRDAASRLDDDERDGVGITDAIGREQGTTIINESGLYSLILTSRKPAAKRFKKWVTAEVLPAIRRTGGYGVPRLDMSDPRQLLLAAHQMTGIIFDMSDRIAELEPKAEAYDALVATGGTLSVTETAKLIGVAPKKLFAWLRDHGWIYKPAGGRSNLACQDRLDAGLLAHRITRRTREDGSEAVYTDLRVTQVGIDRLRQFFATVA